MIISTSSRYQKLTPTISTGIYASGEAIGGLLTFNGLLSGSETGVIQSLVLVDQSEQSAEIDLFLFDRSVTATADNAPINISAADSLFCIGVITILATDYKDQGGQTVATVKNIGLHISAKDDKTIYGQMVVRGTPTYGAVTDLQIALSCKQD